MTDEASPLHDSRITLKDGRVLAYAEYGHPTGRPVLFLHGTPGGRLLNPRAIKAGFADTRIISIDRPGYGKSDLRTEGALVDWVDDIVELVDALGIGRLAVVGPSGGGPYTAACAYKLPERVIAAGLVSCSAPYPPDRRSDTQPTESIEGLDEEAVAARSLSWPEFLNWFTEQQGSAPPDIDEMMASFPTWLPECDNQVFALPEVQATFKITFPNAFRQGMGGWAWDSWTLARPWGFDVEDIQVPTYIWHGELDQAIAVENGRYLAAVIPNCRATFYPDRGHLLPPQDWEAIYTALLSE